MEHIHDLSAKLQKEISHILVGIRRWTGALPLPEQAVLGFTQFDTGQVAQFIAVDRNPVVFCPRPSSLFPGSTSPGCCDKPSEVAHIGTQSQFEFLCAQFLGSESVSGHSVVRVSG